MKFRTILTAYALYPFAYGLPSMIIPGPLLSSSYIVLVPEPYTDLLTQYWGAISIGLGLLVWRMRNIQQSDLKRSLAMAIVLIESMNVSLTVIGIASGLVGVVLAGVSATVHLLFALGGRIFFDYLRGEIVKLSTFIKLSTSGQASLLSKLLKTSNEFYRASFISAALSRGVYDHFIDGKASFEHLCETMAVSNREGLKAWLELGVSLRELERTGNEYQIMGKISKALLDPDNDGYRALLQEIVEYHYVYVVDAPTMLRKHERFSFDDEPGELVARSSRVSEPFIFEAVDAVIPRQGEFQLLEVGCGSGIYIQRACKRNPELRAVGLELQEKVAAMAHKNIEVWGLEDRASIEHTDVRNYSTSQKFDLATLHQNIYYFPLQERENLFRHIREYLKPGGQVLLTSVCQGGGPGIQALNTQVSTTEGFSPLPDPNQLCQQLKAAGFAEVKIKRLLPFESLWAFSAVRAP
jgi:SAM-dependent methyltransferase